MPRHLSIGSDTTPAQCAAVLRYMRMTGIYDKLWRDGELLAEKHIEENTVRYRIARGMHHLVELPWGNTWAMGALPRMEELKG
jgi:hypothetical protein